MIIGTAGHIDHGKTALVKALTGVDTDRLAEEKRRGITIELGFAPLALENVGTVGVVDVPGHEDFVRSMVVGASGIDVALLVIAADEGVMPQTREHLLILRILGIPHIVVALTKADLVDDEWLALVRKDVDDLFGDAGTLRPESVIACSARTGKGVAELRVALAAALRKGATRKRDDLFRLPVDRVFSIKGTGTVVTGTAWSGTLATDTTVRILPGEQHARVRRLEQHGAVTSSALPGTRTAIAIAGLEPSDVPRGSTVVSDQAWRATSLVEALVTLDDAQEIKIAPRTAFRFHAGASETGARIAFGAAHGAGDGLARIFLDEPLTLRGGDRFILRLPAPVRTVGGGEVVDPYASRRGRSANSAATSSLSTPRSRLQFILAREGSRGISTADVPVRVGCTPTEAGELATQRGIVATSHNLFARHVVEEVMATVQRIVAEYEINSPLSAGIPARTLREQLHVNEELAHIAIRELQNKGAIETNGPLVRRPGWTPRPSDADAKASDHLAHDICAASREPPSVSELVSRYGSSVPGLLRYLERQGRIVQVETNRYYDRDALDSMVAGLRSKLEPGKVYVPAQLRDILGSSRKFVIPFLEFCDRSGVTERRGDGRTLRQTPDVRLDTPRTGS